ncbi:RSPH10B [Symbiodinium microadriaticum]|nr:RSPH10B [Symbiodinium microadriaticum]
MSYNRSYSGTGEISIDNNTSYSGQFKNGYMDGKGTFCWENGVQYTGDFAVGEMKGTGQYNWPDGSKYSGEIFYGKRHGNGEFDSSSNQHYEGEWRNGKRHGAGTMYYNAERTIFYKGGWKANRRHGFGCMTYQTGNTYEGEWENDMKCGLGVMTWLDRNELHIGKWREDLPDGHGEHIWTDTPGKSFQRQICNMYRGEWKNGLREGHGCFFYANGSQYVGNWVSDMKHGKGKFVCADGSIQFGVFENNRMLPDSHSGGELPRETDAVNAQFSVNIDDVLCAYPAIASKTSFKQQTTDIQRLVLRYNTAVRTLLKRYTTAAGTFRSIMNNPKYKKDLSHASLKPPASWSVLQLLFFSRRAIHEKFFSIAMQQLLQFARECNLIGPSMTSFDVCMCVKVMHAEHSKVAEDRMKEFLHVAAINSLPPPPLPEIAALTHVSSAVSVASGRSRGNMTMRSSGKTSSRKNSTGENTEVSSTRSGATGCMNSDRRKSDKSKDTPELAAQVLSSLVEGNETEDGGTEEVKGEAESGESAVSAPSHAEEDLPAADDQEEKEDVSGTTQDMPLLPLLLDQTLEPSLYEDMLFPLREREFVELMVRVIAEASSRKQGGVSGSGLFDNIYRIFAETVEPLASESYSPPVFVTVLYAESVQAILRRRASQMRALWDQVKEIALDGAAPTAGERRVPQVKHIVKLMLALRGTAIDENATVLMKMETIEKKGSNDDISSLDLFVTFDDFVEMFCRLVVSDLWMFSPEQDETASTRAGSPKTMVQSEGSTSHPTLHRQGSSRSPVSIIENALSKRLNEWLKLI